jgi:hypothetical protein
MNKNRNEKNHVYLRVNNTTPRKAIKEKKNFTPLQQIPHLRTKGHFLQQKMQRSTASPSAALQSTGNGFAGQHNDAKKTVARPSATMQSTDNDCVASQRNDAKKMTTETHMLNCGRFGCPVVFIYDVDTDWPTVSCFLNDHSLVCKGGFYGLSHLPPRANIHDALSPPLLAPESLGVKTSNCEDEVGAGGCKRRRKEDKRKQELEDDEYTEDVQPTSVRCCGCQKAISLDKRSRYYPGLWVKHRGKCPGIRKIDVSKLIPMNGMSN